MWGLILLVGWMLSLTCTVPIFLPELHRLTLIQVLSVVQDVLQLHFQDTSGNEKHIEMCENKKVKVNFITCVCF